MIAPPADAAEGPAIAAEARRRGGRGRRAARASRIDARFDRTGTAMLWRGMTRPERRSHARRLSRDHAPRWSPSLWNSRPEMPDRIVIPSYNGRRGHPIVLPWTIAAQIHSLPAGRGRQCSGGRAWRRLVVELEISDPKSSPTSTRRMTFDNGCSDSRESRLQTQNSKYRLRSPGSRMARFACTFVFSLWRRIGPGAPSSRSSWSPGRRFATCGPRSAERLPALAPLLSTAMIAVDEEYAGDDTPITPGSRLAVIPPVSGGAGDASRPALSTRCADDRDHRRTDRSRSRHRTACDPRWRGPFARFWEPSARSPATVARSRWPMKPTPRWRSRRWPSSRKRHGDAGR